MKRTLLTFSVVVASACTVYGQARVQFNNLITGNAIYVGDFNQGPSGSSGAFVGVNYSVQLRWAPGTYFEQALFEAANPQRSTPVAFFGVTGGSPATDGAGLFDGGTVALGGSAGTYTMQVQAWYNNGQYSTFESALNAQMNVGRSILFTVSATAFPTPPPYTVFPAFQVGYPCLGPYFAEFTIQPTNLAVTLGNTAEFYVTFSSYLPCPLPVYQWYFNGAPIPGANNSSLQISSALPRDAGSYHVVLMNQYWGTHVSEVATLTVLTPPIIASGPQSQTAELGATAAFQVSASGTLPLGYQWLFNGTGVLNGATDEVLRLTNIQSGQAGAYMAVVTNLVGSVTSAPAMLDVIAPVERRWVPGLILQGQAGSALNLDAADTLVPAPNWTLFDSVMLTDAVQWYFDLTSPLPAQRLFRAWQADSQVAPALDAHMVPAITLTGAVGSKLQVDGINQFGPTDTWFPLATVTLTNTSQLYFDVSVIGQPPRLWRVVAKP